MAHPKENGPSYFRSFVKGLLATLGAAVAGWLTLVFVQAAPPEHAYIYLKNPKALWRAWNGYQLFVNPTDGDVLPFPLASQHVCFVAGDGDSSPVFIDHLKSISGRDDPTEGVELRVGECNTFAPDGYQPNIGVFLHPDRGASWAVIQHKRN